MSDRAVRRETVRWSDLEQGDVVSLGVTRTNKEQWREVAEVQRLADGGVYVWFVNTNGRGGKPVSGAKHGQFDLVTVQRKG